MHWPARLQYLLLPLGIAVGCDVDGTAPSVPTPKDLPALGLAHSSHTLVWRGLDSLAGATIALAAEADDAPSSTFVLDGPWTLETERPRGPNVYSHPLPFLTDMQRPNYPPMGARLLRGQVEVPYINGAQDARSVGWLIKQGTLRIFSADSPDRWLESPSLHVPELSTALAARVWSGIGNPADFVRTEVTTGGVTRPGLQLPPGSEVSFTIDVPASATLEFGVVSVPPLLPGEQAIPASLSWWIDGEEIGARDTAPGTTVKDERVALELWSGKHVNLSFRASAGAQGNLVVTTPVITRITGRAPRHVVLVGIDTLRQDALSLYGYHRSTSPELDAWAAQSVVFTNAWAPAPRTFPSFRTALSGRYPRAAADAPTLAESLSAEGFRTAGVVANVHLVPRFGFNAGFEHWHYENGASARDQVDRASEWLQAHADEDTFLFLHLMDPHTYYSAPNPYGRMFLQGERPESVPGMFDRWQIYKLMERPDFGERERAWIRARYDGEVAYTSAMLGMFLAGLEKLPGQTVTVVHSDHGEEFWDHGAFEHNHTLYNELVRSVLWMRVPGGRSGAERVSAPVGLIDIVPTLLDLVGAPALPSDGRSLAAFLDPTRASERQALAEALTRRPLALGHLMFGTERWAAVAHGWKYILHTASGKEELYDLATDNAELDNRAPAAPDDRLAAMRLALADATGWPVRSGWRLRLDGNTKELELSFESPIAAAGIIDPEAELRSRANQEWGEHPEVESADVGVAEVAADQLSVRFMPGPNAVGHQFWVSCAGMCPAGSVRSGASKLALEDGRLVFGDASVNVSRGTLLEVPPTAPDVGTHDAEHLSALQALGYIDPH